MSGLLLCLFIGVYPAHGQQRITILFVDYRSGKPIKNFYLSFDAWSGKRSSAIIIKDTSIIKEKYSKERDGRVSVRLPPRESEEKTIIFEASTKVDRDPGDFVYVPPYVPHQELNARKDQPVEAVIVRSGQEPIVVNLDIPSPEDAPDTPQNDPFHSAPGKR
jgi:hypothetical protein